MSQQCILGADDLGARRAFMTALPNREVAEGVKMAWRLVVSAAPSWSTALKLSSPLEARIGACR